MALKLFDGIVGNPSSETPTFTIAGDAMAFFVDPGLHSVVLKLSPDGGTTWFSVNPSGWRTTPVFDQLLNPAKVEMLGKFVITNLTGGESNAKIWIG